jgi:uncharacterized protein YndB with AHSA1/START domain
MNNATVTAGPGEQQLTIEREFDAPRSKVFTTMTRKDLVEQWWIGPGYDVRIEALDAHDGGAWHYVQIDKSGQEFSFHGVFHKVSPELIIQTTEFDGLPEPGHVGIERVELRELSGGRTKMVSTGVFMSVADRDALIQSGMEAGMQATYRKLDEVLRDMA